MNPNGNSAHPMHNPSLQLRLAYLRPAAISLAGLPVALAYALKAQWGLATVALAIVALWWFLGGRRGGKGFLPNAERLANLALFGLVALHASGAWLGLAPGWLLASLVAALAGWDLERFARQATTTGQAQPENRLVWLRLQRLGIASALSLILGGAALRLRLSFGFGLAVALSLLAALGLSLGVRYLLHDREALDLSSPQKRDNR